MSELASLAKADAKRAIRRASGGRKRPVTLPSIDRPRAVVVLTKKRFRCKRGVDRSGDS